ncbi:hypothetical protein CFIMG_005827RA [Ceratocystis fimbriata CBS 114723]|uniref:Monopolin complex subunit Csm1/Pcs1 C-terminal domain-containing protein n=1 Tax=Ceratocystis fimbriata CBS 114723 TaxID=1035309 RepID=A0A2C5WUP8_9PEZI|nr:hypothetical protein CFIMG_005827RA [Ceratocystis fimbriata CBS 114723]
MPPARKPKAKAKAKAAPPATSTLGGLVEDSEHEDDLSNMSVTRPAPKRKTRTATTTATKTNKAPEKQPAPESPAESAPKRRGRPPAMTKGGNKVQKSVAKPTRAMSSRTKQALADEATLASETSTMSAQGKTRRGKAVATQDAIIEDEYEDMMDMSDTQPMAPKRGRQPKKKVVIVDPSVDAPPAKKPRGRPANKPPIEPEPETELEESQMDEPTETMEGKDDDVTQALSIPPSPPQPPAKAAPVSILRGKKRPVPVDADSGSGEVALRRKLGEMNTKFESLEAKYATLRDIGIKEAERNYDKLKKQSEERAQTSTQLIAQLKEQVKAQTELAREGESLRIELEQSETTVDELRAKVAALEQSLTDSRAENKNLVTKLAASRSDISIGSGTIGKGASSSGILGGNGARTMAASNEMVLAAQMKEDLYGDLTGLIIRGIKRSDSEDVFDCLQTGRNGTLHFKLAIEQEEGGNGEYEEAQFTYRPQLDENRDGDLIELLPEYLTEEITFPRPHSAKFYTRVSRALME